MDSLGDRARFFRADVSDYKSQASLFSEVFKLWGRIDALCANAGVVDQTSAYLLRERENSIEDIPKEPDTSCTDINYKGVVYGVTLATHFMRHNSPHPGGKIVVTSSIGGMFPHPTYPQYCGSKAAVNMFVRDVAPILKAKDNIFINCVLPGMMDTPIVPPEMTAAVSPEWYVSNSRIDRFHPSIPLINVLNSLTPLKTLVDAYQIFLEDTTGMAGQLLECSVEKHIFYPSPEFGNGPFTKRAVTVWEPLFKIMHGENSGLSDAIA